MTEPDLRARSADPEHSSALLGTIAERCSPLALVSLPNAMTPGTRGFSLRRAADPVRCRSPTYRHGALVAPRAEDSWRRLPMTDRTAKGMGVAAAEWRDGPTVLYVAGSGRSGSTLVERALGAVPGFCNVGEILDLFRGAITDDQLCGCGRPLSTCPFWSAVSAASSTLSDPARIARMTSLQADVVRQRHLPRMVVPALTRGTFGRGLREYADGYADIFRAVALVSGARYIVDASKWPVQALALSMSGSDVRVVHVVRDPRGVAYSQSRTDVARPHAGAGATMASRPALSAAVRWTASQTQVDLLRLTGLPTVLVRYEEFVRDPAVSVRRALDDLGVGLAADDLRHLSPGHADLPPSHGVSGNPSRFRLGPTTLRVDETWRDGLPSRQQKAVLALAAPHLLRMQRRGRRAGAPTAVGSSTSLTGQGTGR